MLKYKYRSRAFWRLGILCGYGREEYGADWRIYQEAAKGRSDGRTANTLCAAGKSYSRFYA